jgi:hypothetical protein
MQKSVPNQVLASSSIPAVSWTMDCHGSSGSFKMSRRQSTPIVYTRLIDNGADPKSSEQGQQDQTPVTRPRHVLKQPCFSLSDCDITITRELTDRAPSRSERLRTEINKGPKGGDEHAAISRRPRPNVRDEYSNPLEIINPEYKGETTPQVHDRRWSTGQITNHSSCAPENKVTQDKIGREMDVILNAETVEHGLSSRAPRRSTRKDCAVSSGPLEPPTATSQGPRPNLQSGNRLSSVSLCRIKSGLPCYL